MSEVRIQAEPRTEFGKGAARRIRRADKVPVVLYGHGGEPRHLSMPGHELMLALKTPNVLLRIDGIGTSELALPKAVQRDPIKGFLEHVDLILVRSGEKVSVEVPVKVTGDVVVDGMLDLQLNSLAVLAEATHIPTEFEVDIQGLAIGDQVTAADVKLPGGVELDVDPEALVLHIIAAPTAEELAEGEEEEGAEAAEGEAEGAEEDAESAAEEPAESAG
ncbi:MAG: 50S ribosomal protein L25/general stress protein Ctc [Streptosporangiales bacterium]|nr:50S ribosomal protein L25/general stress protein Ctc [Streptosporangiales bacterium]MBO0890460.1 50S ribosomal protein L25/general stress protein Ctc [Acidothermales bacterium]